MKQPHDSPLRSADPAASPTRTGTPASVEKPGNTKNASMTEPQQFEDTTAPDTETQYEPNQPPRLNRQRTPAHKQLATTQAWWDPPNLDHDDSWPNPRAYTNPTTLKSGHGETLPTEKHSHSAQTDPTIGEVSHDEPWTQKRTTHKNHRPNDRPAKERKHQAEPTPTPTLHTSHEQEDGREDTPRPTSPHTQQNCTKRAPPTPTSPVAERPAPPLRNETTQRETEKSNANTSETISRTSHPIQAETPSPNGPTDTPPTTARTGDTTKPPNWAMMSKSAQKHWGKKRNRSLT